MFVKVVTTEIPSMEELLLMRFKEIAKEIENDHDYKTAMQQINDSYNQIREKAPELYKEVILNNIDWAISILKGRIQEYFYRQGFQDASELKELLEKGIQ
jgi:hypothetical protein